MPLDFDSQDVLGRFIPFDGLTTALGVEHITYGSRAVLLTYPKGAQYPGLKWESRRSAKMQNWSAYDRLKANLSNASSRQVKIVLKLKNGNGGQYGHPVVLGADEARTLELPLTWARAERVDLARISYLNFFIYQPAEETRVFMDYLRLEPAGAASADSVVPPASPSVSRLPPSASATRGDPALATADMPATAGSSAATMAGAPVKAVTSSNFGSVAASARPGDILDLPAGNYLWPDWQVSGTATRPIVVRSSVGAVINGEFGPLQRSHIQLTGLTINDRIRFNGSNNVSITRCRINSIRELAGDGTVGYRRAENAYIADNTVVATTPWAEASFGVHGKNLGEGRAVTGPGHVIMNNRVSGVRDGITLMEDDKAIDQFSVDILNNETSEASDDGIEADFCMHNCRIMRNRITNGFVAMSSQSGLGGPTYFIRNVAYNVAHVAFKLYRGSIGDVLLHNTVVKNGDAFGLYVGVAVARAFSRNNLLIGGPGATYDRFRNGSGNVFAFSDLAASGASTDYGALGSTTGEFTGNLGGSNFASLAELRDRTTEKMRSRPTSGCSRPK